METITSTANPLIKYLSRLKKRSFRQQEGKFLIEGPLVIEEALANSWPLEMLLFTPELLESTPGQRLVMPLEGGPIKLVEVSEAVFKTLADTQTPRGLLGLARIREHSLEDIISSGSGSALLLVVVDGVQDPGNLGTIIRSSDAFGAHGVLLTRGSVDLYNDKTLRSTMGSIFHLPVLQGLKVEALVEQLQGKGIPTAVALASGGTPVAEMDFKVPMALVVGSEARGPSSHFFTPGDTGVAGVSIPMPGRSESLNAAVAASVLLYEISRQRGA